MYTAVIIDDEPLAIDVVFNYLNRFSEFEIHTFTDSIEGFKYLNDNSVDLVFTDIAMPQISGIELIQSIKNKTQFVVITSYRDHAIESFELNVIDYLLKPVSFERFTKTIERFKKQRGKNNNEDESFYIKEGDEFIKVLVKNIDYVEGMRDYAKIVCGDNYYLVLQTLKLLEQKLERFNFIRIHKSFIIPLSKITQCNNRYVTIQNTEIPIGSSYRNKLKKHLEENKM